MDLPIPAAVHRRRKVRHWSLITVVVAALALATLGLSRLQPAIPRVQKASIYLGTVERGELVCQVRGNGTLVPEQIQFVQAETDGRIERILAQPGATVTADTVLLELSNPELQQAAFDAEWQVTGAEAQLARLRAQLENDRLTLQASVTALKADATQAEFEARANEALDKEKLVSHLEVQRSRLKADELHDRLMIEQQRSATSVLSVEAQLAVQQAEVERARALLARKRQQVAALRVLAGVDGVLQQLGELTPLQIGQRVSPSATLAKIVQPTRLKAVLKIAETQVKDVQFGQKAEIDTRNGIVPGSVSRIDPAAQNGTVTVEVKLDGPLPRGARPDLNVDGIIELERLESVLHVGRPVQGQADTTTSLFKLTQDGKTASRVQVGLGHGSVSSIEIRYGLEPGDTVILSDMAQWSGHDRLRLD